MNTRRLLILLIACLSISILPMKAQERVDSDSIIKVLQGQLRERDLREVIMREQLERSGESARKDSMQKERLKASIDSLRNITKGAALIIDGDTLLKLYANKGNMPAETRVEEAREKIVELGKQMSFFADSCYVFNGEYFSDVMCGNEIILSLSYEDGLWEGVSRQELAERYCKVVGAKIESLHEDYGLKRKLMGLLMVVLIIAGQWLLYRFTRWLYRRWRIRLLRMLLRRTQRPDIKDNPLLDTHRLGIIFLVSLRIVYILIIFTQLLISIPLLFSVFPETESFAYTIFNYIWNPIKDIFGAIVKFLPNLFKIIVIVFCFHYLVKGIKYLTNEIATGRMKINGFYADWAHPTFVIVRILLYSFMFVMIWPLLPSSDSEVFQGVSVFIGIIVSLGSSSIIGNVMAGMVMTYMRPFKLGDFIKYGETEGFVIEKTVLVTRIRTRKNDVITIPNANLLTSQTSNYTVAASDYGIIVHTKVTIGYDMNWKNIRQLLLDAAAETTGIEKSPKPFVVVTSLDDYYVEYEINAYTRKADTLAIVYSELRQNILDSFHKAGVEIMSPHIYAHRTDLELQIPKEDWSEPHKE